jgi:hypothetical protein
MDVITILSDVDSGVVVMVFLVLLVAVAFIGEGRNRREVEL